MTATREVTLWCDYTGPHSSDRPWEQPTDGDRCAVWTNHGQSSIQLTRRLAKQEGWRAKPPSDYCPRHAREET